VGPGRTKCDKDKLSESLCGAESKPLNYIEGRGRGPIGGQAKRQRGERPSRDKEMARTCR